MNAASAIVDPNSNQFSRTTALTGSLISLVSLNTKINVAHNGTSLATRTISMHPIDFTVFFFSSLVRESHLVILARSLFAFA